MLIIHVNEASVLHCILLEHWNVVMIYIHLFLGAQGLSLIPVVESTG